MRQAKVDAAPTSELLKHFDALHQQQLGERAVIQGGKDAALVARLWKTHGEARVKELMAQFFLSRDPFIRKAGYTMGVFISQAGKLIAQSPRGRERGEHWSDECARLHQGRCTNLTFHRAKVAWDAEQAGR